MFSRLYVCVAVWLSKLCYAGPAAKGKTSSIAELSNSGTLLVKTLQSVRTDFGEKESYQKVVCFGHDGSVLVTGGMDAIVRVWKVCGHIMYMHNIM